MAAFDIRFALNLPTITRFVNENCGIAPIGAGSFRIDGVEFSRVQFDEVACAEGWSGAIKTPSPFFKSLPRELLSAVFGYRRSTDTLTPNVWYIFYKLDSQSPAYFSDEPSEQAAYGTMVDAVRQAVNAILAYFDPAWSLSEPEFDALLTNTGKTGATQLSVFQLAECALSSFTVDLDTLTPVTWRSPKDFYARVSELNRPYLAITEAKYNTLAEGKTDHYRTRGGLLVTFGGASCFGSTEKFALMPFMPEVVNALNDTIKQERA